MLKRGDPGQARRPRRSVDAVWPSDCMNRSARSGAFITSAWWARGLEATAMQQLPPEYNGQ
eukprot:354101-Chlamydomonas_euryale.AAC.2